MMNLEKMKQKKRTNTKSRVKKSLLAATTFLCLTTPLLQTQTAYAAENTTPAITIEKPLRGHKYALFILQRAVFWLGMELLFIVEGI